MKWTIYLGLAVCILLVVSLAGCESEFGDFQDSEYEEQVGGELVTEVLFEEPGRGLYAIGGYTEDKAQAIAQFEEDFGLQEEDLELSITDEQEVRGAGPTVISGYNGGSYGNGSVSARFHSNVQTNFWDTKLWISSGNSETRWTGSYPQRNSTLVRLADSFTCSGITGISADGFDISGSTATWNSGDISDRWYLKHVYSGIECSGLITQFKQSTTGSHYFDTTGTWVSRTTNDKVYW